MRIERTTGVLVQFVGIGNFGDAADGQLCRQSKVFTNMLVGQSVYGKLSEGAIVPGRLTDGVTGGVGTFERVQQALCLVRHRKEFQVHGQSHGGGYHIMKSMSSMG